MSCKCKKQYSSIEFSKLEDGSRRLLISQGHFLLLIHWLDCPRSLCCMIAIQDKLQPSMV